MGREGGGQTIRGQDVRSENERQDVRSENERYRTTLFFFFSSYFMR